MKLTKKSIQGFHNRYPGCGSLFVKTSDSEIQVIDFNLGRNGKFYTMDGTELTARLNELSTEITKREAEQLKRETALAIIKNEWAQHGKETLQSRRVFAEAFTENRVSKGELDKATEEGRAIFLQQSARLQGEAAEA